MARRRSETMRPRWQFRLQTLMIAVALVGLASWYRVRWTRTRTPTPAIQPADFLQIEVKHDLVAGRPIFGNKWLVRTDGRILLGFYGDVYVAGLTESEARDKIALHLRQFLKDMKNTGRGKVRRVDLSEPSEVILCIQSAGG